MDSATCISVQADSNKSAYIACEKPGSVYGKAAPYKFIPVALFVIYHPFSLLDDLARTEIF